MDIVDYCVSCYSQNLKIGSACLDHFVIDRMTNSSIKNINFSLPCNYLQCQDCGFNGIDIRFSREEEFRYYQNYMKEEFINHRCEYEGYQSYNFFNSFNTADCKNARRKGSEEMFLSAFPNGHNFKTVLDYGGDTGELIPSQLSNCKKYVTDCDSRVVDGITFVSSSNDCEPIDFVFCAHTLEHVSFPLEIITDIKKYMKQGSWLMIEVPNEDDAHFENRKFHEHINIWNLQSLQNLLESNGFDNFCKLSFKYPKVKFLDQNEYELGAVFTIVCQLK